MDSATSTSTRFALVGRWVRNLEVHRDGDGADVSFEQGDRSNGAGCRSVASVWQKLVDDGRRPPPSRVALAVAAGFLHIRGALVLKCLASTVLRRSVFARCRVVVQSGYSS